MTVLMIGGACQGKCALAKQWFGLQDTDFAEGETCTVQQMQAACAVNGLHRYTRRHLAQGLDGLLDVLHDKIVLCDEIGCGVVPFEKEKEDWREQTGRLLCDLAAQADLVVRVYAGMPQVLKGKLPEMGASVQ